MPSSQEIREQLRRLEDSVRKDEDDIRRLERAGGELKARVANIAAAMLEAERRLDNLRKNRDQLNQSLEVARRQVREIEDSRRRNELQLRRLLAELQRAEDLERAPRPPLPSRP